MTQLLKEPTAQATEPKPDLQVLLVELIGVNKALLKKLEEQSVSLTTIAKFVRENSSSAPTFGVL
jgi:hypothetical protein